MEWINIKNKKPNENSFVLVTDGNNIGYIEDFCFDELNDGYYISGIPDNNSHTFTSDEITHWMLFPVLPNRPERSKREDS